MTSFFLLSSFAEIPQASYILDHNRACLHPEILMLLSDQEMLSIPCTCLLYPRTIFTGKLNILQQHCYITISSYVTCLLRFLIPKLWSGPIHLLGSLFHHFTLLFRLFLSTRGLFLFLLAKSHPFTLSIYNLKSNFLRRCLHELTHLWLKPTWI